MENVLKEKLKKLQEIDFVLADIKLYLDTHPCDTAMLMKYCMFAQKSMMLRNEIETRYRYPLTAKAAAAFGPRFGWINSPWPWCGKDPKSIDAAFNPCQAGSIENECPCTCECANETEVCN